MVISSAQQTITSYVIGMFARIKLVASLIDVSSILYSIP